MSRYIGPKHKLCRREGVKLCDSPKCPVVRRNYPPGIHGVKGRGRMTSYGKQLREKQKVKRLYGLNEKQFSNYFEQASKKAGNTEDNLAELLELRLDNVIYRLGLAHSRAHARQLVNHGYFTVNSKKVDIPSYHVKPKDLVHIKESKKKSKAFSDLQKKLEKYEFPSWIYFDSSKMEAKVTSKPEVDALKGFADLKQIIEFYSR